jgi:hypothetical protein
MSMQPKCGVEGCQSRTISTLTAATTIFIIALVMFSFPLFLSCGFKPNTLLYSFSGDTVLLDRHVGVTVQTVLFFFAYMAVIVLGLFRDYDHIYVCIMDTIGLAALLAFGVFELGRFFEAQA